MRGVNKVILVGNLGEDPKLRHTPSGTAIASFSVATSESWKDKQSGEMKERTEWHRCETWGRLAEVCAEYLGKGSKIYVEGSIRTEEWKDKDSGADRKATKIRVAEMHMLDSQRRGGAAPAPEPEQAPMFDTAADDIPF